MSPAESAVRPPVSILFLTYNHEAFVEEALLSALGQDLGRYELVVVDDASKDRTRAIIEEVLQRGIPPGVTVRKLYKDKNGGLIASVNEAMAASAGDVFVFMAGDDVSPPCRLTRTLRAFSEHPAAQLVYGECEKIDENGRPFAEDGATKQPQRFSYDLARLTQIYAGAVPFGASAAYRRQLFDVFGPMGSGDHGEDNCYWIRALLLGEIYWDPACFVKWRQHDGNLSNFNAQITDATWRNRHIRWMEKHTNMSRQWLKDIAVARGAGLITWQRARRLEVAALREDRTWALSASSLSCAPWGEWLAKAASLVSVGRFSTTFRLLKVRLSRRRQDRAWRFWAKLKSNPAA